MTQAPREPGLAQVTPRYLAGGGDPRWVTAPLQQVFRWQIAHAPLSPVVRVGPRDLTAELHLSPDPDQPWWILRHLGAGESQAWTMSFGARTPAETVAAATNAFAAGPGTEPPADPAVILERAGWTSSPLQTHFTSPDEHVHVGHHPDGAWHIAVSVGVEPWRDTAGTEAVWEARFTDRTPTHVVAAFLTDLVSPDPVLRNERTMAPALRYSVRIQRERVPAKQAESALWDRVHSLRPRRTSRELPPPSPQQPGGPLPRRTR
ncbi:DUF317 domain-containing protein [Streptomyces sp. NPDC054835]|uniref:DUF317 domain-containing protein n=1 Tax=Streptomyces exfoliatus TaxID=1905 RepID=UPI000465A275|nr:DUF317 domain-containing protein [Streptomyces exfoliatus]